MKKITVLLCALLLSSMAFAENADAICGLWFLSGEEETFILEVYEKNRR